MSLETTRVRVAQHSALSLKREIYFALDAIVVCAIFVSLSYLTWGSLKVWRLPEVALPAIILMIALPVVKLTVLRNETDRVRRLAKLHLGIIAAYALLSIYLVLSRAYYSRFFLTSSFITLMLWQIVDTLLLSAGLRPQLVAVPSKLVEQIKSLPEANVTVLGHPQLETPATSEMWCKFSSWSVSRFYAA